MTQAEARRYVADQIGVDPVRLSALLDALPTATETTTLEQWSYITGQIGHTSPQELQAACIAAGAVLAPV